MVATPSWNSLYNAVFLIRIAIILQFYSIGTLAEEETGYILYQCAFSSGAISCYTHSSNPSYACCYDRHSLSPYTCGEDQCYGEITYQVPGESTTRNPYATTTPRKYTWYPYTTRQSKGGTPWYEKESSDGVEASALLIIFVPVGVVFVTVVVVGVAWCVARFKGGQDNSTSHGVQIDFSTPLGTDIENALNASLQESRLNNPPPEYYTAVDGQDLSVADNLLPTSHPMSPDRNHESDMEMQQAPPSYDTVVGQTAV